MDGLLDWWVGGGEWLMVYLVFGKMERHGIYRTRDNDGWMDEWMNDH